MKKNCFVKLLIEIAVKIRKNTCNFTSGLKPATLVRNEIYKNFHDSFYKSYFCGTPFGGFLLKNNLLLGNFEECSARKHIAFINNFKACVYQSPVRILQKKWQKL